MSIDNLKSVVAKKGGLARPNRFNVIFTPPSQSILNLDVGSIIGSVLSGNFEADNLINDPRDISLLCQSVTLPGRNISTFDHEDFKQSTKFPYTFIDSDVTVSFLLTNDYYMRKMFDNWMSNIFSAESYIVGYKKNYAVDLIIQQLDQKNTEVAALADEATTDWYSARRRAHRTDSPSLTGPEAGQWRRAWALGDRSRRARSRQKRWPEI